MLIYSGTKGQFDKDVLSGSIARKIENQFWAHGMSHDNASEFKSWQNSLSEMQKVLGTSDFTDNIYRSQLNIRFPRPQNVWIF